MTLIGRSDSIPTTPRSIVIGLRSGGDATVESGAGGLPAGPSIEPKRPIGSIVASVDLQRLAAGRSSVNRFERSARLAPNDAYALSLRGFTWMRKRRSDLALSDLTRRFGSIPRIGLPATGVHRFGLGVRRKRKALSDFDESIRRGPDLPANNKAYKRGPGFARLREMPALRDPVIAVASAKKACQLTAWKDADCLRTLAAVYSDSPISTPHSRRSRKPPPFFVREIPGRKASASRAPFREKRPYHESGVSMKRANSS